MMLTVEIQFVSDFVNLVAELEENLNIAIVKIQRSHVTFKHRFASDN